MKLNYAYFAFLFAPVFFVPHQQYGTPFEKCRMVTLLDLADPKAPRFADYSVPVAQRTADAKLDLKSSPIAREYRTLLRRELANGPNFAGHYRVAVWGCGTSCAMFAVIDTLTGRVIVPDGFSHTSGVYFDVNERKLLPESQSEYGLFAFRKDSRLLAILGDIDEDERREGAFYFVLDGEKLKLIHTTAVKKDCECSRRKTLFVWGWA